MAFFHRARSRCVWGQRWTIELYQRKHARNGMLSPVDFEYGHCQKKLACGSQGGSLASDHANSKPLSLFQNVTRDHPNGGDVVRPVPSVTSKCRRPAALSLSSRTSRTGRRRKKRFPLAAPPSSFPATLSPERHRLENCLCPGKIARHPVACRQHANPLRALSEGFGLRRAGQSHSYSGGSVRATVLVSGRAAGYV